MKIAGIDPSINSSGKVIMDLCDDTYHIKSIKYYAYNSVKKNVIDSENVSVDYLGSNYTSKVMYDRQDIAYNILLKDMEDVKHVAVEGYAFGSTASRALIQMGEFIGGIKKTFYDLGKGVISYPPTAIKRFATNSGTSDKSAMVAAIKMKYLEYYPKEFDSLKQYESPHSDMVDAFWIAEVLRNHLIYDVYGSDKLPDDIVTLLNYSSSKKVHSIVDTVLYKKKV